MTQGDGVLVTRLINNFADSGLFGSLSPLVKKASTVVGNVAETMIFSESEEKILDAVAENAHSDLGIWEVFAQLGLQGLDAAFGKLNDYGLSAEGELEVEKHLRNAATSAIKDILKRKITNGEIQS